MHHQGSAFTSTIIAGFESYIEAGVQCADTHAEVLGGAVAGGGLFNKVYADAIDGCL